MYRSASLALALALTAACSGASDPSQTETEAQYCDGAESCPVDVSNALAVCGDSEEPSLSATAEGSTIHVSHLDAATGCCPTAVVEATLLPDRGSIDIDYDLSADDCDCVCPLDVSFDLVDVPTGDWTLLIDGVEDVQVYVWGE